MVWPLLTFLAFAALVVLHLKWRDRCLRIERQALAQIEDLKQQQAQATAQFQTQQKALFNSIIEGVLLLDEAGKIQLANNAFSTLFGLKTDVRSKTIMEALRLHELADLIKTLGTERQVLGRELKLAFPSERWLQVNAASILDGEGGRHGTVLVFHDLTRLKQLENTRKDFVANVSHELRTPLSLIKGYVETLLDGAKDNPEFSLKFLQTIERNADRLQLLIEDLLVISELESGRVKLNFQPVSLSSVVAKVFEDFKSRAVAKGIQFINQAPDLAVRADAGRLEQVLGNLVDNGIKYGRSGGSVIVGAKVINGNSVEVAVKDDGPGIPAEALDRLFERFYRVDKARSREQGGTGLGLSIVKHIVQSHGGAVWASSQLGHGATFYFTLPQDTGGIQQPLR